MNKIRLDQWVQKLYPNLSRNKVKSLIEKGKIKVFFDQWKVVDKPGFKLDMDSIGAENLKVQADEELQYVSRGALKLKQAIEEFKVSVEDRLCLDVGLSTGGFSDFLIQNGAKKVLGVDVGKEQIHPSLRANKKMFFRDKVNARDPLPEELLSDFFAGELQNYFDLIVIDVSFISQSLIIPNIKNYLAFNGIVIGLIKPQFELTKQDLNKKGVVKEPSRVKDAVEKILGVLGENKLEILGTCPSPIEGENGNQEFLFVSRRT